MTMTMTTQIWRDALKQGIEEDNWNWDWTSLGSLHGNPDRKLRAEIVVKAPGVWAADGLDDALERLSHEMGSTIRVQSTKRSGEWLKPGSIVMKWSGPGRILLAFERPALNLAAYVSGIATATRRLVELVDKAWRNLGLASRVAKLKPRITATRKTLPWFRDLAIYGVQVGGGFSHRLSLSGGLLIKENHIMAAGGIAQAIKGVKAIAPHGLKLEVEVRSIIELKKALKAGAEAVLLDNFSPAEVKAALSEIGHAPILVEVSGGLNEANISEYVLEGVNVLSVGSLTHSVKALDLSLLIK